MYHTQSDRMSLVFPQSTETWLTSFSTYVKVQSYGDMNDIIFNLY